MRFILIITIFTLLCLSCACEGTKAPASPQPTQSPITLEFGQSVILSPTNHSLTFDSLLVEARCPADVLCIWGGFAEIRLQALSPENDTSYIHLIIVGNEGNSELDTLGYRFSLKSLSPYPQSSIPPVQENYTAIIEYTLLESSPTQIDPVIISNAPLQTIETQEFFLRNASINNDSLNMVIQYGGGCTNHYFELHMSPAMFTRTTPPQVEIYLRHFSQPDYCLAFVHKELTFDITPIKELHRELYGNDGDIILNIHSYRDSTGIGEISLLYPATGLIDSTSMWPMAVGNYWIYLDSIWENGQFQTTSYDTIQIHGTSSDRFGHWWEISQNYFFDIRNYIMNNNDSIFARNCCDFSYSYYHFYYPAVRYIPAVDSTIGFTVMDDDILNYRTVTRVDSMVSTPAGNFSPTYIYTPESTPLESYTQILAPGIGFIYFEMIKPPLTSVEYIKRSRLVEYYVQ